MCLYRSGKFWNGIFAAVRELLCSYCVWSCEFPNLKHLHFILELFSACHLYALRLFVAFCRPDLKLNITCCYSNRQNVYILTDTLKPNLFQNLNETLKILLINLEMCLTTPRPQVTKGTILFSKNNMSQELSTISDYTMWKRNASFILKRGNLLSVCFFFLEKPIPGLGSLLFFTRRRTNQRGKWNNKCDRI